MKNNKIPIGLVLPIQGGNEGYFEMAYDSFTQRRINLINLLRTRIGERRMQPQFGCRLWSTVFEPNTDILADVIQNILIEDINRWLDGISIKNISVRTPQLNDSADFKNIYKILITVTFEDVSSKQEGSVDILLDTGKV